MNKKDIDPANFQMRPIRQQHVDAGVDRMCVGAPQPEYCRETLGSASKGAGMNTSLVAEARTSILQAECKGKENEVRRNRV